MAITVEPSGAALGAEISGVDLSRPIDQSLYEEIEAALAQYGVVCFRDQPLSEQAQEAFIRWFGPPNAVVSDLNNKRIQNPYFYDVSNVDERGEIMNAEDSRRMYLLANLLWHSDMSMRQPPARVTALSAQVLPPVDPPNTEFVDTRLAWEALPEARKKELEGLTVEHSVYASRARVGFTQFSEEARRRLPPVAHPLVRTHARSGRKALYIGAHASHIVGWPIEEGRKLLEELAEFATQPHLIYAHRWRPSDLLVWDNSCTMHRATPYDDRHKRELRWCSARELEPV